jgi:zinc/manganese transport system permease protein
VTPGNPSLSLDLVADVRQLLAFPFMVHALQAGAIVAVLASVIGWYMVLRGQSFVGHTLSVMAFPGATGAALAGFPGALGYYLACVGAALAIGGSGRAAGERYTTETAAIGTVQAVGLAAGFLFLSLNGAVLGGPETLLFGTFLGVSQGQVLALLGIAIAALAALAVIGRPLLFATVDADVARARGVPVRRLDTAFLLILAVAVAATSQITGALLVFALLVAPPAAAQLITVRPVVSVLLSAALALLVVWLALGAAYFSPFPVGFFITTFALALYILIRLARGKVRRWAAR